MDIIFELGRRTGICALGDGLFYLSGNGKDKTGNYTGIRLYLWTGEPDTPLRQ